MKTVQNKLSTENWRLDIEQAVDMLEAIQDDLKLMPTMKFNFYKADETAIIVIDMINGFALEGALASERVEQLIEPIAGLLEAAQGMKKVFLCDHHLVTSAEFESYLPHAIQGSDEALIVQRLNELQDEQTSVIFKNSTNGMMAPPMQHYLQAHPQIKQYILVGDCTDICVLQFALSLKAYFNEQNEDKAVLVPMALVDTYDLPTAHHGASLMNLFAFYNMKMNGIKLFSDIQYERF